MLISLSTTSLIGQATNKQVDNKPYITVNSAGDTVINNLPVSFVVNANVEHQKQINCQTDLDSCEQQVTRLNQRSILYKIDLDDAKREKDMLKSQKNDLQKALDLSKENTATLESKLNKQIKIRNVLIPFFTATTITSGIMTTLHVLKTR